MGDRVVVRGYSEFLRACQHAERDSRLFVRHTFRDVGEIVRRDAAAKLSRYDTRSAAGFKVRVRQRGVAVEQSLRKTTGKHPQFGALQMTKALLPALADKEGEVDHAFEVALDLIADRFEI